MTQLKTTKLYFRVDRREIAYLKFIFEACDGIATITTIEPQTGHVLLRVAPGCAQEVQAVLGALKKEILIEPAHSAGRP